MLILVGARSYVLRSVSYLAETSGIETLKFSGAELEGHLHYSEFEEHFREGDVVLMVGTPGDVRLREQSGAWSGNQSIPRILAQSPQQTIVLSTIRTERHRPDQASYARHNREFESLALSSGARVLRLGNFWGVNPQPREPQRLLAPWIFCDKVSGETLKSPVKTPDEPIGFVTPITVLEQMYESWDGIREPEPEFFTTPGKILSWLDPDLNQLREDPLLKIKPSSAGNDFAMATLRRFIGHFHN